jgi:hypothetical protein
VILLATRVMHLAGIIAEPHEQWMKQVARNSTDGVEGFLRDCRYLIHDRSSLLSLLSEGFRSILKSTGVGPVRLPARSPNLNAFAERFVREGPVWIR